MDQLRKVISEKRYISSEVLRRLLTPQLVGNSLNGAGINATQDLVDAILTRAPRLFSVLLLIDRVNRITTLLESGWDDGRWPLSEVKVPEFDCDQKRQEFFQTQWLLPPIFTRERHLEFPGDAPLPLLEKDIGGNGSFGVIWKVKIAAGHLQAPDENEDVAMKTIRSNNWDIAMREVETLRQREHQNIVPLLASFTINALHSEERSLNILFPWADMNMTQWLRLDCSPLGNSVGIRDWLYREIFALVSAVSFLHREIDGIVTSHHDLKPDNILWLGGSLKICDLGRSHLLPAADGSETEGRAGLGTFSYQPPEYYNDDGTRSSRKHGRAFDVWSLGCILLEMATLIVYGWQGRKVQEFETARASSGADGSCPRRRDFSETRKVDDSFHNNPVVIRQWLCTLKEKESRMLIETLKTVEKMLTDNPDERIYSWEAELDFFDLIYPDSHITTRLEKMEACMQPPKPRLPSHADNPLHRAIRDGNKDRTALLLRLGWPVDVPGTSGLTPLQLAGQRSDVDFETLFQNNAISTLGSSHQERNIGSRPVQRGMVLRQKNPGNLSTLKAIRM